ncbi:MAG TPA: ribosome maturation factor RimM [Methylococcaceae bacterium]|nr:ribosome maturation factor RimM [Methylococcaceae bacterium]
MERRVVVGKVAGVYGVKGWVKIRSFTAPEENIFAYAPWQMDGTPPLPEVRIVDGRRHGSGLVAQLEGIADRDQAATLVGRYISVPRSRLPAPGEGEYYQTDLLGMRVVNLAGVEFGHVDQIMETGANDVLVVMGDRERLIPFTLGQAVREVDLAEQRILVDWEADF